LLYQRWEQVLVTAVYLDGRDGVLGFASRSATVLMTKATLAD